MFDGYGPVGITNDYNEWRVKVTDLWSDHEDSALLFFTDRLASHGKFMYSPTAYTGEEYIWARSRTLNTVISFEPLDILSVTEHNERLDNAISGIISELNPNAYLYTIKTKKVIDPETFGMVIRFIVREGLPHD